MEKSNPQPITPASSSTDWNTFMKNKKVWTTFDPFLDHVHKGNSQTNWQSVVINKSIPTSKKKKREKLVIDKKGLI